MLPLRGDPKSRLVTALAFIYRSNFWFLIVWAPIAGIVVISFMAREGEIEAPLVFAISAATLVALIVFAVLSIILARGIMAGNRVAYLFVGLAFFVVGVINILIPLVEFPLSPPALVHGVSRFAVYSYFGCIVFILGARSAHAHG